MRRRPWFSRWLDPPGPSAVLNRRMIAHLECGPRQGNRIATTKGREAALTTRLGAKSAVGTGLASTVRVTTHSRGQARGERATGCASLGARAVRGAAPDTSPASSAVSAVGATTTPSALGAVVRSTARTAGATAARHARLAVAFRGTFSANTRAATATLTIGSTWVRPLAASDATAIAAGPSATVDVAPRRTASTQGSAATIASCTRARARTRRP